MTSHIHDMNNITIYTKYHKYITSIHEMMLIATSIQYSAVKKLKMTNTQC